MRDVIVALDLETTGLNQDTDEIIEIGAARFQDGEVLETFSTLIDPGRSIPEKITALTGIQTDDLIGQPRIRQVLDALRAFIGDAPVVGHRVDFDLGFLRPHRVATHNLGIDTYELVSVLLPTTPRYNLTSLTNTIGVDLENAHRALDDAIATGHLYWEMWQRIMALPLETLVEIVEASRGLPWAAAPVFEAALQERSKTAFTDQAASRQAGEAPVFAPLRRRMKPLTPQPERRLLDVDALAATIEDGGVISDAFPAYEEREQQVAMLRAVTEAFNQDEHLMVEAPTGVGKSLAYLVPAVMWAVENNERVVISTATINLQDQLITKDLPMLQQALDVNFHAAVLKGRNNYLCPRRLATLRRRGPTSVSELRVLAKILVWLLDSDSGDKGEVTLRGFEENAVWAHLSAADEGCTNERCETHMQGTCPFYKARQSADAAHVLVVNHALLLSDVQIGSRVLPDYRYLVIDEAHHLEDATTNGLSFQMNQQSFQRELQDLGTSRSGILGDVIRGTRGSVPGKYFTELEAYVNQVSETVDAMGFHVRGFFDALTYCLQSSGQLREHEFINHVRITPQLRQRADWIHVQEAWHVLSQFTRGISDAMKALARGLSSLHRFDVLDYDNLLSSVQSAARHLESVHQQLAAFTGEPDDNTIYWVQVPQDRVQVSIHSAPLNVGPLLHEFLWEPKNSVILTSATLRTGGTFDYMRDRLQTDDMHELVVGTPFDYETNTLVYIPTDIPSPSDRDNYQRYVERGIIELAAATQGRLLGLFTSYSQLRQTSAAVAPRLAMGDITVFDQSDGTSRQALLDGFKSTERAVLFGTRSFWEGVDVPGDDLSVVVIVRLPFSVPSDPIFAARAELYDNSFMQYAVPDAILRFRQGFGRLIRTKTDRGVIALFDNRVITKRYGQLFLDSLPPCTVRRGSLMDLPRLARAWIDGADD